MEVIISNLCVVYYLLAIVLETVAQQRQQVLIHLQHLEHQMIKTTLGIYVLDVLFEILKTMERVYASLVNLQHGRIARHNEGQLTQDLDHVSETNGQLVAQVVGRLEQVGVVVGDAHVHHCHGIEANDLLFDGLVDLGIAVEEANVGEALPRLGEVRFA